MNTKKKYLILGIFGIIFMFFGGTLSYWQWESNDNEQTKVTFTVENDFSCSVDGGGDITSSDVMLAPASCTNSKYAIQRTIKVNPTIDNNNTNVSMDLWLDVNNIENNLLASDNFKYALTTESTSCIDGIVQYGSIKDNIVDNKLELLNNQIYSQTYTDTYYLYIWLDKKETNSNTMNQTFNLSLNGNCTNMDKGEPFYVVYSEPNSSLRFYKPTEATIIEGEEYNGEIATKVYKAYENDVYTYDSTTTQTTSPWNEVRERVTTISIEDEISPLSTANWFKNFTKASNIDVTKLDTSNTKTMYRTFDGAGKDETITSFKIIGLDKWDTSNVTNMRTMLQSVGRYATDWDIGDLSTKTITKEDGNTYTAWDTSNVTIIKSMFNYAGYNATKLDIGNIGTWNISKVMDTSQLFGQTGCYSTTWNIGDLSNWDTSNVVNVISMFHGAGNTTESFSIGNLSEKNVVKEDGNTYIAWDVSDVTDMSNMFYHAGYNAITWNIGDLSNWDTSNVTNMIRLFNDAGVKTTNWNIGNLSNWDTSNVTDMSYMFKNAGYNSTNFNIGNIASWKTSQVTNMIEMFNGTGFKATNWSLNLSNWNVDNVERYTNFNLNSETKVTPPNWIKEDLAIDE